MSKLSKKTNFILYIFKNIKNYHESWIILFYLLCNKKYLCNVIELGNYKIKNEYLRE